VLKRGHGLRQIRDGKAELLYRDIGLPLWSPHGNHIAYVARTAAGYVVVRDGRANAPVALVTAASLSWGPRGKHLAWVATTKGGETLVTDGRAGPAWKDVFATVWSADGRRVAYGVQYQTPDGVKARIVVDGRPGPTFTEVGKPVFSPNGRRVAYPARQSKSWQMVVDGRPQSSFKRVGHPVFGPRGHHVAYVAVTAAGFRVITDGKPGRAFAIILGRKPGMVSFDSPTQLRYLGITATGREAIIYAVTQRLK
jgi:hypothetical protein